MATLDPRAGPPLARTLCFLLRREAAYQVFARLPLAPDDATLRARVLRGVLDGAAHQGDPPSLRGLAAREDPAMTDELRQALEALADAWKDKPPSA